MAWCSLMVLRSYIHSWMGMGYIQHIQQHICLDAVNKSHSSFGFFSFASEE